MPSASYVDNICTSICTMFITPSSPGDGAATPGDTASQGAAPPGDTVKLGAARTWPLPPPCAGYRIYYSRLRRKEVNQQHKPSCATALPKPRTDHSTSVQTDRQRDRETRDLSRGRPYLPPLRRARRRTIPPGEATTCVPSDAYGLGVTRRPRRTCSAHTAPIFPCRFTTRFVKLARSCPRLDDVNFAFWL